jgi:uncharacterized UBP type Zn finger protein
LKPILYELQAVINHHGDTQLSGHYTAIHRAEAHPAAPDAPSHTSWILADDSRMSLVAVDADPSGSQEVVTPDTYMLLYRRKE